MQCSMSEDSNLPAMFLIFIISLMVVGNQRQGIQPTFGSFMTWLYCVTSVKMLRCLAETYKHAENINASGFPFLYYNPL